ncbi:MAG: hypothetical protein OEQ39_00115 [Gammaproteobacteria bacterium]|nr:hypothetical protein [Gammaproteobacteria bacterium]
MAEIRVGDQGTIFEATVKDQIGNPVNISSATQLEMIFKDPNGVDQTKTAVFSTDGLDGKCRYVAEAGFINMEGTWERQVKVTLPTGVWSSEISTYTVYRNLA